MKDAVAITHLLKEHNAPFGASKANKILLGIGVLEEGKRESSVNPGQFKTFKKISDSGEKYGKNEWNDYGDAQPKFFPEPFPELLALMIAAMDKS
ncbi:MAG: hypothetical protein ACRBC3_11915 [Burkholderiaceae bacterium]